MKTICFHSLIAMLVLLGGLHVSSLGQEVKLGPKKGLTVINYDDWKLRHARDTPFEIAQIRKYYGETRILIYLEPKYFDCANLENIFSFLSSEYKTTVALWIDVYGNKDVLADEIAARFSGHWSWEDLPDSVSQYKKDGLGKEKYAFFRSTYQRYVDREFYEMDGPGKNDFRRIIIRQERKTN